MHNFKNARVEPGNSHCSKVLLDRHVQRTKLRSLKLKNTEKGETQAVEKSRQKNRNEMMQTKKFEKLDELMKLKIQDEALKRISFDRFCMLTCEFRI